MQDLSSHCLFCMVVLVDYCKWIHKEHRFGRPFNIVRLVLPCGQVQLKCLFTSEVPTRYVGRVSNASSTNVTLADLGTLEASTSCKS
jgi:hypothetical protein